MKCLVISHKRDNFPHMFTHAGNEAILVGEYNSTMICKHQHLVFHLAPK